MDVVKRAEHARGGDDGSRQSVWARSSFITKPKRRAFIPSSAARFTSRSRAIRHVRTRTATTTWSCCARTQEGYQNLIKLVSTGYLEGFYYKPRIDKDLLARHSKGLIALSACLRGDVNETLLADRYEDARRLANEYQDLFGKGNFFLEMQDHGLEQDKLLLPQIHRLSADTDIPLVATNDSHYLRARRCARA